MPRNKASLGSLTKVGEGYHVSSRKSKKLNHQLARVTKRSSAFQAGKGTVVPAQQKQKPQGADNAVNRGYSNHGAATA